MAQYFFDTGAVVKYYHAESETPMVSAIFSEPGRQIRISTLGFLEIQSAFAMKVRSGVLERGAGGMRRARLMLDVAEGGIEVFEVTGGHFPIAGTLCLQPSFAYA